MLLSGFNGRLLQVLKIEPQVKRKSASAARTPPEARSRAPPAARAGAACRVPRPRSASATERSAIMLAGSTTGGGRVMSKNTSELLRKSVATGFAVVAGILICAAPLQVRNQDAGALSRCRRQRNRRRAGRAARCPARHLPRLEHHRRRRPATVTGGALCRPCRLCRGSQKSRGQRRCAGISIAERCRRADSRGGCE